MNRETKQKPRTIDKERFGARIASGPFYEEICRGRSEQDIALLKAAVELDAEKAFRKAKNALADGANVNAKDGRFSVSALMLASSKGYIEVVELLVNRGADMDAKDDEGLTALWYARRANRSDVMAFLQERGAKA